MPHPMSNDLRERVVGFVEADHSRRAAAAHFLVSPSFVVNLMALYLRTGRVTPRPKVGVAMPSLIHIGRCSRTYCREK